MHKEGKFICSPSSINSLTFANRLLCIQLQKEAELAYYTSKNVKEKMIAIRNEITLIEAKMKNITYDEKCLLEGANVICTTLNSCCALSRYLDQRFFTFLLMK